MVQGYYTLEESASILGMSADELKQLARKGELRSFQDRGTWRFRIQDIQELARSRGQGSEPELVLGETPKPKPTDSPAPRSPAPRSPAPRSPTPQKKSDDVFGFSLDTDEQRDSGINLAADAERQVDARGSKGSKRPGSSKRSPKPGSDSDVRLVADGSDVTFSVPPADSDVKVVDDSSGPKSGPRGGPVSPPPRSPRPAKLQPPAGPKPTEQSDSGVRLVPMDSDSDVRIVGAGSDEFDAAVGATPPKGTTDSDIRVEGHRGAPPSDAEGLLTEEINLDEELKRDEAQREAQVQQAKLRAKEPEFPKTSPFELSEADLDLPPVTEPDESPKAQAPPQDSSDFELTPMSEQQDGSSDFDLTPSSESSSPLELGSSDDFRLEVPDDDETTLQDDAKANLKGPSSGINLNKPADSGISLEQSGEASEEVEFSLTLDADSTPKPSTPRPSKAAPAAELDSDSEFELSLDLDSQQRSDSDSEFELTLDDSGGLEPLEDETPAPAAKKGADKDIFETDFEVPGLEEDSGSDAVAVEDADTDLESSDFELAIGEEDVAAEEDVDESGSMVVALDEEEPVDDAAETMQAKSRQKKKPPPKKGKGRAAAVAEEEVEAEVEAEAEAAPDLEMDEGFEDLQEETAEPLPEADEEAELDEAEPIAEEAGKPRVIRETVVLQQAPWGAFPAMVLMLCVPVMVLLGIMGVELVQQQQGYKPGVLTKYIGGFIDNKK
jgi:hypothetical protein